MKVKMWMRRIGVRFLEKSVGIDCPLVCRWLGFVWRVGGRPESNDVLGELGRDEVECR